MNQIDKLFDSIKKISKEKTKAYDTQATVTRVDGGTVYVHIPGGVDETPIEKTIAANPGDIVQIRVANGRAWATGNASAPPTDDKVANIANKTATNAKQTAGVAQKTAGVAKETAEQAAADVREQKEYFWHDEQGAHVLSDTDQVSGKRYRTDLKGAGQEIFEIDGQNETSVAKFGADGARVGSIGSERLELTAGAMNSYNADGVPFFTVDYDGGVITTESLELCLMLSSGAKIIRNTASVPQGSGTCQISLPPDCFFSFSSISSVVSATNITAVRATSSRVNITALSLQPFTLGIASQQTASVIVMTSRGQESITFTFDYDGAGSLGLTCEIVSSSSYIGLVSGFQVKCTTQTKAPSFMFGTNLSSEYGTFSSTLGEGLKAESSHQIAVGKFNDNKSTNLFEVGNGTADNARSNAFEVSSSGNVKAGGSITDGSGNILANKADASSIPETDHGLTEGVQTSANSYKDLAVTFNETFLSVPTVVCSLYSTSTAGALGSVSVSAINVTTTGFTARVFNAGSSSRTPAVSWMAIL